MWSSLLKLQLQEFPKVFYIQFYLPKFFLSPKKLHKIKFFWLSFYGMILEGKLISIRKTFLPFFLLLKPQEFQEFIEIVSRQPSEDWNERKSFKLNRILGKMFFYPSYLHLFSLPNFVLSKRPIKYIWSTYIIFVNTKCFLSDKI